MAVIACFSGKLYGTRARENFKKDRQKALSLKEDFIKYYRDIGYEKKMDITLLEEYLKSKNDRLMKRNKKYLLKLVKKEIISNE